MIPAMQGMVRDVAGECEGGDSAFQQGNGNFLCSAA